MWDFFVDLGSAAVDAVTTVGSAAVDTASWVLDEVDSVFGDGVGASAITGAVLGGVTAAITDEDILDNALLGGLAGGAVKGISNAITASDTPAIQNTSPSSSVEQPSSQGLLSEDPLMFSDGGDNPFSNYTSLSTSEATTAPDVKAPTFDFTANPATSMAYKGLNLETAADSGVGIMGKIDPVPQFGTVSSDSGGTFMDKLKKSWTGLADDKKSTIIGNALSGGAQMYAANKAADAAQERDDKNYERQKTPSRGISSGNNKVSLVKDEYQNSNVINRSTAGLLA